MIKHSIIAVLILIICIAGYISYSKNSPNKHINNQKKQINVNHEPNNKKKNSSFKKQRTKHIDKSTEKASVEIGYLDEFENDPVIKQQVTARRHDTCIQYFYYKKHSIKGMEDLYKNPQQKQFVTKAISNCEKLNKQHPDYGLDDTVAIRIEKNKLTSTTKFGQLLELSKIEYTEAETLYIFKTVAQNYPSLINSPILYKTMRYEIDNTIPELMQILQTTQVNYASRILHDVKNHLACELGADCSIHSSMMLHYCRLEPNFCVNDYDKLFNTRFPSAVKADILLVLPYIESLY